MSNIVELNLDDTLADFEVQEWIDNVFSVQYPYIQATIKKGCQGNCGDKYKEENEQLKQQIEKMKADRWHYVADGDLPKDSETMCIFLSSNTYGEGGVPIFNKSNLNYHFGFYSFYMDENGDETSEPCWYDVNDDEEIDPMEVYAWQEIELPTMELR